jgi:signal transduction histidine kinase
VSPEDRSKIFEPFFSKRPGGSGLGLAVCQGILRAHGGSIVAEDREGGGTTFRVMVPGAAATDEERG